ncbi:MAG: Hsp20/alpha crystallin family protein [Reichenbachiella sp.]|uniref:Hsp20/alpha crystallin family protein n=1 Tax=Reichenbachiella sp. TaxID=2184521 RepID=UPI003264FD13
MNLLAKTGDNLRFPALFSGFFDEDTWSKPLWNGWRANVPAANVLETDNEFKIELAAPGMEKKDFHVNIENGALCISSEKEMELNDEQEDYTRKEFSFSSFSRSFLLPDSVNDDKVKATYKDGVLSITLPKKEEAKKLPKKEIKIA